jgi:hypothetical protein
MPAEVEQISHGSMGGHEFLRQLLMTYGGNQWRWALLLLPSSLDTTRRAAK